MVVLLWYKRFDKAEKEQTNKKKKKKRKPNHFIKNIK
jgi:hypothetical protein